MLFYSSIFFFHSFNVIGHFLYARGTNGGSEGKESACSAGDPGSISGSVRCPGEGNGYPLQCSCLENSMDRGAWWATVQVVTELDMTERLTLMETPVES